MVNGMVNGMTVTIDRAGRIVVPKPLRDELNLKPGTEFTIARFGSRIELELMPPEGTMIYKRGIPVWTGPADFDVVEEINRAREEASDHVLGVGGYDRDDFLL